MARRRIRNSAGEKPDLHRGSGRADASHVVEPNHFEAGPIPQAYAIAQHIPERLNQLYCWFGCLGRRVRAALGSGDVERVEEAAAEVFELAGRGRS